VKHDQKVKQEIPVQEIDGKPTEMIPLEAASFIEVESEGILPEWVVLVVDGYRYTVEGADLIRAVENAMNVGED